MRPGREYLINIIYVSSSALCWQVGADSVEYEF